MSNLYVVQWSMQMYLDDVCINIYFGCMVVSQWSFTFLYDSVWVIADAIIADYCCKINDKHTTDANQVNGAVTWQTSAYWATAASLILVSGLLKVVYLCMKYTQDPFIDESDQSHRNVHAAFYGLPTCLDMLYTHMDTHVYFCRLPVGSELPSSVEKVYIQFYCWSPRSWCFLFDREMSNELWFESGR